MSAEQRIGELRRSYTVAAQEMGVSVHEAMLFGSGFVLACRAKGEQSDASIQRFVNKVLDDTKIPNRIRALLAVGTLATFAEKQIEKLMQ